MPSFAALLERAAASVGMRAPDKDYLLDPSAFESAAAAERMRVDRNGSVVAVLLIRPAPRKRSAKDISDFVAVVAKRLRLTDTAGCLRDGRIGVLLPDTPAHGAWKVAADLCEVFPVGADRPDCEVFVYPDQQHGDPPADLGPRGETGRAVEAGSIRPAGVAGGSAFEGLLAQRTPAWKRTLDVAGATVGLIVAAPIIAAAALAVKLNSPGPAFFCQEREGLGGRRFKIRKLRTMRIDAEALKGRLLESSDQDGPAFKMHNDPRVTAVGRILRKTSVDELPQLLNVLWGEMSLVGPRPLPVAESQACRPWQRRRLQVTPGITCIWQVRGRNAVSFDEWVRMDLEYAERRSLWLDLRLVAETGPALLTLPGR